VTASSPSKVERYLSHIVENAERIAAYLHGLDEAAYGSDLKTQDAVERCLQRIAEAANRISKLGAQHLIPGLPWRDLQSLGNRLRHEYDGLDTGILWETLRNELPLLKEQCIETLAKLQSSRQAE
jgi:uncharacterized protein with HEPN domain